MIHEGIIHEGNQGIIHGGIIHGGIIPERERVEYCCQGATFLEREGVGVACPYQEVASEGV